MYNIKRSTIISSPIITSNTSCDINAPNLRVSEVGVEEEVFEQKFEYSAALRAVLELIKTHQHPHRVHNGDPHRVCISMRAI